jgi:hypothetical protein
MNIQVWHEEPISKRHDREAFDCGETVLSEAAAWHASHGALLLLDAPLSLLLPPATVAAALKAARK